MISMISALVRRHGHCTLFNRGLYPVKSGTVQGTMPDCTLYNRQKKIGPIGRISPIRPIYVLPLLAILGLFVTLFGGSPALADEMNFPQPEFTTEYDFPLTVVPEPTSQTRQWIDVVVLLLALSLAAWLAVKKRSRRGLFWLMIFSLLYFGFSNRDASARSARSRTSPSVCLIPTTPCRSR